MRVFFYGTLLDPPTLRRRAGAVIATRPATVVGWRRVALNGTPYPTLRRDRCGRIEGLVVTIAGPALARLHVYEGPRYRLTRVVLTDGSAAWAWIAPGGTDRGWTAPDRY